MTARRARTIFITVAVAASATALLAPPAMAVPDGRWNCYATPIQINLGSQSVDPFRAGIAGPCVNQKEGVYDDTVGNDDIGTATIRGAYGSNETHAPPTRIPVDGNNVQSRAGVADVILASGSNSIRLRVTSADARGTCVSGAPVFTSASTIQSASVNGEPVQLPDDGEPMQIPLGAATLHLNEEITTATSVIRRAARLENPTGNIVIAESAVGHDPGFKGGNPCVDDGTGNVTPPPANTTFACRASAERWGGNIILPAYEPIVANPPFVPCRSAQIDSLNEGASLGVRLFGNYATTRGTQTQASAKAGAGEVMIPTQAQPIRIDAVNAETFLTCIGSAPFSTSSSRLGKVSIAGQEILVGNAPFTYNHPLFRLILNRRIPSATSLTRRAVDFQSTSLGNAVIGEASVGLGNTPCA